MKGNEIATFEEAINFIEKKVQIDVRFCTDEEVKTTIEVFKLACVALGKQIPKKPYADNENGIYVKDYCPTCNRVLFPDDHHCKCGQALDWSD